MRKSIMTIWIAALVLAFALASCAPQTLPPQEEGTVAAVTTGIASVNKHGSVILDVTPQEMTALGYEPADLVQVELGATSLTLPIGTAYSDVDSGDGLVYFKIKTTGESQVVLALNMGDFVSTYGIAETETVDQDPGYAVRWAQGYSASTPVRISMAQKQGYAQGYQLHRLGKARTNDPADYPDLDYREYANFREVLSGGMGAGALYRSSSPVNPALGRNEQADRALGECGVAVVLNMADSESVLSAYPGYDDTRYAQCDVLALDMGMDFATDDFRAKWATALRYMATHEGPYLLHCKEGKDRTGFGIGVLSSLMGATTDEIVADYMLTYYNYYGIGTDSEQYLAIAQSNLLHSLARSYGVPSMQGQDLSALATAYIRTLGLTDEEIAALIANLSRDYTPSAE